MLIIWISKALCLGKNYDKYQEFPTEIFIISFVRISFKNW